MDSERVREEMAHRGWSQADLALIAGLSKQTVSTAVRGVSIRPSTARAIQTAFERHPRRLDGILAEIPA